MHYSCKTVQIPITWAPSVGKLESESIMIWMFTTTPALFVDLFLAVIST